MNHPPSRLNTSPSKVHCRAALSSHASFSRGSNVPYGNIIGNEALNRSELSDDFRRLRLPSYTSIQAVTSVVKWRTEARAFPYAKRSLIVETVSMGPNRYPSPHPHLIVKMAFPSPRATGLRSAQKPAALPTSSNEDTQLDSISFLTSTMLVLLRCPISQYHSRIAEAEHRRPQS